MATVREKIFLRMKELNVKQVEKICMVLGLTLGNTDEVYKSPKTTDNV